MSSIWIIKAGSTFPETRRARGDFDQWTRDAMGLESDRVRVFDVDRDTAPPDPRDCAGVVITGAHAMVTDELAWSVRLEQWIPDLVEAEVPLLGICYGHQLIAKATGGRVDYNPRGREVGTVHVEFLECCRTDALLSELHGAVPAHVVHAQSVVQLPPGAELLARNGFEPVQAYRVGKAAWGVQFHPEYDAAIMQSYIEALADELRGAGRDVAQLLAAVTETPAARGVMRRFAALCEPRSS